MPCHGVDADGAEQQADGRHQERARQRCRREVGEQHKAENEQGGIFWRAEPQGKCSKRRSDQGQHQDAEGARDPRADGGDAQRRASPAALRHCVTVDAGHDRGRFAWNAHQDRGGRAAVLRAVVDAGQHNDGSRGVEAVGDGQQDADAGQRSDAGQHANQRADYAAKKCIPEDARLERHLEAKHQAIEGAFHASLKSE